MTKNTPPYDPLISKTWKTKGTRFSADERLRSKHSWSVLSLSILSLYLIILSTADIFGIKLLPEDKETYKNLGVLFLSIFILIITLIESSKNYLVQAEKMHQCALEIQSIYHKLQLLIKNDKDTYDEREKLLKEYDAVLFKYPNHEERAYNIFKCTNYMENDFRFWGFKNTFIKLLISQTLLIWYWVQDFWLYAFFIFAPPATYFLIFS